MDFAGEIPAPAKSDCIRSLFWGIKKEELTRILAAAENNSPGSKAFVGKSVMPQKKAVILTGHFPVQKRRANIHWISDHLQANGWHVTMVTMGYSWVSRFRGDRRFKQLNGNRPQVGETVHDHNLTSFFDYAPLHPFSLKQPILDWFARPFHQSFVWFWSRRLGRYADDADLVLIESGPPIMLAAHVRRLAPKAAMVYRVSDDMRVLGLPDFLFRAELEYAPLFDRISMASKQLARRFAGLKTVHIDPVGVDKATLDGDLPDPFSKQGRAEKEAVCAGTTQFDEQIIRTMAELRPNWNFHIIGRLAKDPKPGPGNLIFHGEIPFPDTAAFVKHADIGLAPYIDKPGVEYQTAQSNRMMLYRYYGLPMIGPESICDPDLPNVVGYDPGSDVSMAKALLKLDHMARGPSDPRVNDWVVLYERIVSTPKPHGKHDLA